MNEFVTALVIGVAVAAPLGPLGVLCIQRTLANGWRAGAATGMGVASADAVYAALGALGIGVGGLVQGFGSLIRIGGALVLLLIAWRTLSRQFDPEAIEIRGTGEAAHVGRYVSAFVLTLSNPITILEFAAIFAGLGLASADPALAPVFVSGVALGSLAWWLVLTSAVTFFRSRITGKTIERVNRGAALVLASAAVWLLFGALAPVFDTLA